MGKAHGKRLSKVHVASRRNIERMKAALITLSIALMLTVATATYISSIWPQLWWHVKTTEFKRDARINVYRSVNGELLFWLQEDSLVAFYCFYPATNEVANVKLSHIRHVFPEAIYLKDEPVPVVNLNDQIEIEQGMNTVIENNILRLTVRGRYEIVVDLKSP